MAPRRSKGTGAFPRAVETPVPARPDPDALYAALPGDIPLSIELRSRALREAFPDLGERAKAVAQATRRWLQTQAVTEAAR